MKHSQKMALVPCDDLLIKEDHGKVKHASEPDPPRSPPHLPPPPREIPSDFLKEKLYSLDEEMNRILNNKSLPPEEKAKLYNLALEDYILFTEKYTDRQHGFVVPPQTTLLSHREEVTDLLRSTLETTLPRTYRKKGNIVLDYLERSDDISWSPSGQVIIKGEVIPGSNIIELLHHKIRYRRKPSSPPTGFDKFEQLLNTLNLPEGVLQGPFSQSPRKRKKSSQSGTGSVSLIHNNGKTQGKWYRY